jgi:hypothetical protein
VKPHCMSCSGGFRAYQLIGKHQNASDPVMAKIATTLPRRPKRSACSAARPRDRRRRKSVNRNAVYEISDKPMTEEERVAKHVTQH